MSALILIAILVVLIVAHEFGHFIAAKLSGVRVEEFGVGYPPRALTLATIRGTEYTLNWLPFGGFVRLLEEDGMELDPRAAKRAGSFAAAPRWKQAVILAAGVFCNVLAGWLLFAGALTVGLPAAVAPETEGAQLIISGVMPGSPADVGGLRGGDVLLQVSQGGARATLDPEGVSTFIGARGGKEISFQIERADVVEEYAVQPAHAVIPGDASKPAVGVELAMVAYTKLPFGEALVEAAENTWSSLKSIVVGLGTLIRDAFNAEAKLNTLVGPVGLTSIVGDAAGQGIGQILALAAFISLNLAVINLLPIPALDGGRLVFVGIETIIRRRIPTIVSQILNTVGFLAIVLLMVAITVQDVAKLVG